MRERIFADVARPRDAVSTIDVEPDREAARRRLLHVLKHSLSHAHIDLASAHRFNGRVLGAGAARETECQLSDAEHSQRVELRPPTVMDETRTVGMPCETGTL